MGARDSSSFIRRALLIKGGSANLVFASMWCILYVIAMKRRNQLEKENRIVQELLARALQDLKKDLQDISVELFCETETRNPFV